MPEHVADDRDDDAVVGRDGEPDVDRPAVAASRQRERERTQQQVGERRRRLESPRARSAASSGLHRLGVDLAR